MDSNKAVRVLCWDNDSDANDTMNFEKKVRILRNKVILLGSFLIPWVNFMEMQ